MTIKSLAYLALMASWICFCYWLYAEGIYPRLHRSGQKSPEMTVDSIAYPLGFIWTVDIPIAGIGFGKLKTEMDSATMAGEVMIIHGYFFRDEAEDRTQLNALANRRIDQTIKFLGLNAGNILTEVSPQEITADVRSNPFEAVRIERIAMNDIVKMSGDTLELCFPLKDSFELPGICKEKLATWMNSSAENKTKRLHVTGTADGSGIAEPMDMAMERALWIKSAVMANGWKEEQILLSTGQRNHPLTLRNHCVVLYFE